MWTILVPSKRRGRFLMRRSILVAMNDLFSGDEDATDWDNAIMEGGINLLW